MAEEQPKLAIEKTPDITVVQFLERNILDEASIYEIGQEIGELIDESPEPKLLLDFANVDHLSSAALGTLITINKKIRQKDGQLRLANIDPQIYEVFEITKLNDLFHIHDTTESAMASFT